MSALGRRAALVAGLAPRWVDLLRSRTPAAGVHVSYGRPLPPPGARSGGGLVKFQRLQEAFPNHATGFNVLYLGSNTLPPDSAALLRLARRRGIPVVWNQNGVAYPAWHGPGWERANRPMRRGIRAAVHVVFQSEFCRLGAERFLGAPSGTWEVLHNPVDTAAFTPVPRPERPLTLLLGGNQYQRYRLDVALETLARLDDARLVVTGDLSWTNPADARSWLHARLDELGVADRVELAGSYAQRDAPEVLRRGDVLLHTKVNDPCPTVVLEAMACGLPVVYAASGGTPELVGEEAGVGVESPLDWERDHPPAPDALADAVRRVAASLDAHAAAARRRSELFDIAVWVERHRRIFEKLCA